MTQYMQFPKMAWLLIAPQIMVILLFFIWPAGSALLQAFYYRDAFGLHKHFAGWGNFIDLFQSADWSKAALMTLLLAVVITFLTMAFGLLLAVLVSGQRRGKNVYKSLLLWPYAVAPAVAAILWRFLCHPTLGWLTGILQSMGIDFNYLIHPSQAFVVIVLTASWQQFSYNFLFYLAALRLIPQTLIDAAIMDGASTWKRFWQIIFPLLSPTSFFLLTMNLIYSVFDTFGIIHILTHGGPGNTTTTLIYKVYHDGFIGMDPGSSAAQSVLLMLIVVTLTLLQFRYLESKVHYE